MKSARSHKEVSGKRQFAAFALVGVVSTFCNLTSRYAFELIGTYEMALIGANAVGVLTAFVMNRWFVFLSNDERVLVEGARFLAVNLVGITVSWAVAVFLYRKVFPSLGIVWQSDLLAHAIGIFLPVIPNYFAHRWWTFGRR